jgi:glycosyltransferase involved in cell wall biosynthesis
VYTVVIPAFNQLEYCWQCVQSIQLGARGPYKLVLVDNGSTDGVGEYFDSVPGAVVVHTGENLGYAGGSNAGLAHAEGHVVLLNSDTLVPAGGLDRLVAALDRDPRIGLIGPRTNTCSGPQQIDNLSFATLEEINAYADALAARQAGQLRDVARLVGFCLVVRDSLLREIGPLDESFGIGNFEDDDYCLRAARAGRRLCIAEDCFVFHYGSRTFVGMGMVDDAWRELIARNERIFGEKWRDLRPEERDDAWQAAAQWRHEASAAVARGDFARAMVCLLEAIKLAPGHAAHYADLGDVLLSLGETARARAQFERALRLDPACARAGEALRALPQ